MPATYQVSRRGLHSHGFTLLELLVVMVIIGLLAGFVAPRYFAQVGKSRVKAAHAQRMVRSLPVEMLVFMLAVPSGRRS